ncbi:MAG: CBS domain-containing protein [Fimbriimonadales bacterium]
MRVTEIMSTDIQGCGPDTTLDEVARRMADQDCGIIPVLDSGGRILGVITDRDIACRAVASDLRPSNTQARTCMTQPVVTLEPDASVEECSIAMRANGVRRLPIAEPDGTCLGMVSLGDIAKAWPVPAGQILAHVHATGRASLR